MTALDVRLCGAAPPYRASPGFYRVAASLGTGLYALCRDGPDADAHLWRCDARGSRVWGPLPKPPLPPHGKSTLVAVERWLWLLDGNAQTLDGTGVTQVFDTVLEQWAVGPAVPGVRNCSAALAASFGPRLYVFRCPNEAAGAYTECQTLDAVAAATAAFPLPIPPSLSLPPPPPPRDDASAGRLGGSGAQGTSWQSLPNVPAGASHALAYVTADGRVRFDTGARDDEPTNTPGRVWELDTRGADSSAWRWHERGPSPPRLMTAQHVLSGDLTSPPESKATHEYARMVRDTLQVIPHLYDAESDDVFYHFSPAYGYAGHIGYATRVALDVGTSANGRIWLAAAAAAAATADAVAFKWNDEACCWHWLAPFWISPHKPAPPDT